MDLQLQNAAAFEAVPAADEERQRPKDQSKTCQVSVCSGQPPRGFSGHVPMQTGLQIGWKFESATYLLATGYDSDVLHVESPGKTPAVCVLG